MMRPHFQKMCNSHPHCTRYFCPFAHSPEELRKPSITAISPRSPQNTASHWNGNFRNSMTRCSTKLQCPGSPMSASTTASSSTVTSPMLASFSPAANLDTTLLEETHFPSGYGQEVMHNNGFLLERKDSGELLGLEPLALSFHASSELGTLWANQNSFEGPSTESITNTVVSVPNSSRPPLTQEEAQLYSDILVNVLQREGLTDEEKLALKRYKMSSGSIASVSTFAPRSTIESVGSFDRTVSEGQLEHQIQSSVGVVDELACPPGLSCTSALTPGQKSPISEAAEAFHNFGIPDRHCLCENRGGETSRSLCHLHHGATNHFWNHTNNCYGNRRSPQCGCQDNSCGVDDGWNDYSCCHQRSTPTCRISGCGSLSSEHRQDKRTGLESYRPFMDSNSPTPRDPRIGSDPLLLLTALSLLDSATSPKTESGAQSTKNFNEDATTLLIAEVLKHISEIREDPSVATEAFTATSTAVEGTQCDQ